MRDLIYKPPKTKRHPLPALTIGDQITIRTTYDYSSNSTAQARVVAINGAIGYVVEFRNGTRRYIASSESYRVTKL